MTSTGSEREIERPELDPGMRETDDHAAGPTPRGGHQPAGGLDRGAGDEHLSSPSQGVRPVPRPADADAPAGGGDLDGDEAAGGGPDGEEEGGGGPAFEDEGR